ncbi:MAG: glycogen/starch/alpha-glucan phosphorylase [Bacillaceae bacterium]
MFANKKRFKAQFLEKLELTFGEKFDQSTIEQQYYTLGNMVREYISTRWIKTNEAYRTKNEKEVFYFSIEFLIGTLLGANLINLGIRDMVEEGLSELGIKLDDIEEIEADAGLGNGGLGRLAACFLDSMASLNLPGHGFGIRYKHGLFEQKIVDGYQVELPDQWLRNGYVWEVRRSDQAIDVHFYGRVDTIQDEEQLTFKLIDAETISAVPYDVPVVGYKTNTVNTLRLWSAEQAGTIPKNKGILQYKRETEAVSEFLYPDDTNDEGKVLRLKQQYFLVSASLQNILRGYKNQGGDVRKFHEKVAIQINDTHPVLAIPELMRLLMDEEGLGWDEAWYITTQTMAYTNHTTLSEALEKWPIRIFQPLLPRIYMIVNEINERYCHQLWDKYPGDWSKIENMAIIAHDVVKMAHLAIAGSHSVNGVAQIHTDILKERELRDFYEYEPEKFNNKTNGITHRRWLLHANPQLTGLIKGAIGDGFIKDPYQLTKLNAFRDDKAFQTDLAKVKKERKEIMANYIKEHNGIIVDPNSIFDIQIKRLHAYKRQLLNVMHIMYLYNRIKADPSFTIEPRTFIFGAKASPGYYYAKRVIKLINSVAQKVNNDPQTRDLLKVVFIENYRVSIAEKLFPSADVSEQISTASKEASGTGNMKFMMNGAVTMGTLDGANIEIGDLVGEDNIFIFGLNAAEVMNYQKNGGYRSSDYYYHDLRIKEVLDQLINGFFPVGREEFEVLFDSLLIQNDEYFVLRDFSSYVDAQARLNEAYKDRQKWARMCITNIAQSGHFSSDRTISEYAKDIWNIKSIKVK